LNYKQLPEFWNLIRGYGVVPFVAFPLQATTRVARAVAERPAVLAKYGKIFRDFETVQSGLEPGQIQNEKSVLPPDMDKGLGWLRLGRIPPDSQNPNGRVRYLNLGYVLPLWMIPQSYRSVQQMLPGGVGNQEARAWTSAVQGGFLNVSYYPLAKAVIEGVDPFTGKKFASMHDFFKYLYNYMAPPLAGTYLQQMWAALHGKPTSELSRGTPKTPGDIFARSFLAWSTRDVDPQMEQIWRMRELQQEIPRIEMDMRRIAEAPYITEERRNELLKEQMDRIRALIDEEVKITQNIVPPPGGSLPASTLAPEPGVPSGGFKLLNF